MGLCPFSKEYPILPLCFATQNCLYYIKVLQFSFFVNLLFLMVRLWETSLNFLWITSIGELHGVSIFTWILVGFWLCIRAGNLAVESEFISGTEWNSARRCKKKDGKIWFSPGFCPCLIVLANLRCSYILMTVLTLHSRSLKVRSKEHAAFANPGSFAILRCSAIWCLAKHT